MVPTVRARPDVARPLARLSPSPATRFAGPAVLRRDAFFDADGIVSLSERHLRFEPSRLARWSGPEARRELALSRLERVTLHPSRRRVEVAGDGSTLTLCGPLAPRLYAVLRAWLDDGALRATLWEAKAPTGMLSPHGILAITSRRVFFVMSRATAAFGEHDGEFDLLHEAVTCAWVVGRRIMLGAAERRWEVEVSDAGAVVDDLARGLRRVPYRTEPATSARGAFEDSHDITKSLRRWGIDDDEGAVSPPRLAGPAVVHRAGLEVSRYDLVLSGEAVRLLPPEGPAGGRALVSASVRDLGPPRDARASASMVVLRGTDGPLPILPRGCARFARDLWRCLPPRAPSSRPDVFAPACAPSTPAALDELNRRASLRLPPPRPVEVQLTLLREVTVGARGVERVQGETHPCELLDVSAEGIGLALDRALSPTSEVLVRLRDGSTHFLVPARVVHVRATSTAGVWRHGLEVPAGATWARGWLQRYWSALQRESLSLHAAARAGE
jgi:PilZ domain